MSGTEVKKRIKAMAKEMHEVNCRECLAKQMGIYNKNLHELSMDFTHQVNLKDAEIERLKARLERNEEGKDGWEI